MNYAAIRFMREGKLVTEEVADRLEAGETPARVLPSIRSAKTA